MTFNWNTMANSPSEHTQQDADALFFIADAYIKENKILEGKEALEKAIAQDPKHGRSYNHLGWIYERKYRDYVKAAEMYEKAVAYAPEYTPIYLNYSVVLNEMGKRESLKSLLEQALTIPGVDKGRICNEYGIMLELEQEYDKAIEWYKKAIVEARHIDDVKNFEKNITLCQEKKKILKENFDDSSSADKA